jgi:S-adenosylmethionine-diacylgycerolhomoserine-N-methlytransferase
MAGGAEPHSQSHAEHMDGIYRYQRYIYDLTRKFYLLGRDRMIAGLDVPKGGTVLEVGCGTGRNLILAARKYPDATFYGFDISKMMLETAEANIAKAGLSHRIKVAQGDASDFSAEALFGIPAFDRVYISYAVSMIPPWRAAIAQGYQAVKPGGSLHIVDFGQQAGWPGVVKRGLHGWLAKFSVEPRADLEAELRTVATWHGATMRFEHLTRDYAQLGVLTKPSA